MNMIYLDHAASSPLTEGVKEAWKREMELWANPSSLHRLGFEAELRLKTAREEVAAALRVKAEEIVFTSGGTEADNLAVFGAVRALHRRGNRILTTDSEHPAVEECMKRLEEEGFEVKRLSTRQGALDPEEIEREANEKTILAALMHTNNETGAVYDLATASRIIKRKSPHAWIFSDGVQGFLKSEIRPAALGVDLMSLSSHKIHGPKGVGALYIRKGLRLPPLILGGGQEKGIRNGTENLPGIVAFGQAAKEGSECLKESIAQMERVKSTILQGLADCSAVRPNLPQKASCHVLSLQVHGFRSEVLLHQLSQREIFVSSGSACSSHKGKSPVLRNFGLSAEESDCTLRLSLSRLNTVEEGLEFVKTLKEIIG